VTTAATTTWCELAWLGGTTPAAGVVVDVEGEHITAVRAGVATPPAGATVRRGLTLPGMANAHSHAFHRALRGRTHGGTGSFWTWRDQMYAVAADLDPDRYRRLATAVFAEMVLAGFTAVGEFHYLHHDPAGRPYAEPNAMGDALVDAAATAGIRLTLLDTCYLHGGIGQELNDVQRRFADASVDAWVARAADRREPPHVRLGAAVHSVRACTPGEIHSVAVWATKRAAPLHAHVSEQPAENEACRAAYATTPTGVLSAAGALGERFTAVHATHLGPSDVEALATGSVCLCPTTERDLADGIGPAGALAAAGARLCIGSDSHAVIDPFEETRAAELDERLATGTRGTLGVGALAAAATVNGHGALGWSDAGRIEVGWRADLVTVSLDSVRLAGTPPADALAGALYAAGACDVTHVVVGGREVVTDGHHARLDVAAELTAVIREVLG
jgi:formiminoglutamate deiminase